MNLPFIVSLLISGALGSLGLGSYLYIRNRIRLRRRRARLERHLRHLQRLTSKLLNACHQLLKGDAPEETALYQVFSAHGGEYYDDLRDDVHEALCRSQHALNAAFDLRQKLTAPAARRTYSLEQKVWLWEMLYATLVGHSERIHHATADELHALLDPLFTSGREALDVQLVEQLDNLRRILAGMPLRIGWQMISPDQIEAKGILGYIDQVKAQTAHLPERHRHKASHWLAKVTGRRRVVATELPSFLTELYQYIMTQAETQYQSPGDNKSPPAELTEAQLFRNIDERLVQVQAALDGEQFQEVVEGAASILQDLETVSAFLRATSDHGRRQVKIGAITSQGYRPLHLEDHLCEVRTDVQTVTRRILAGDYAAAAPWIKELDTDSQRALASAETWQALHDQNVANLEHLGDEVACIEGWWQDKVALAWQTLQAYPEGNWADIAAEMDQAQRTFQALRNERLGEIKSLNCMALQKLAEAERMLDYATADVAVVKRQFQAVVNRLATVQAAQAHVAGSLRLVEMDVVRAEAFRDQEDAKIGSEVDEQIEQARRQLAEAGRLMQAREFMAALDVQTSARQLAIAAYMSANEQVREINALQVKLEAAADSAHKKMEQCLAQAQRSPPVVQTPGTNRLGQQLQKKLSEAERGRAAAADVEDRDLAEALRAAIAAYEQVDQLAEWMALQITADRREYGASLNQALTTLADAQAAIQQAEHRSDISGARRHALRRAQIVLPPIEATKNATREALARLCRQAEEAQRYARQAVGQDR
jgi:hypothetical protein